MNSVFPEAMNRINPANTEGSISTIDNYIRYMCEHIDFAMTGLSKQLGVNVIYQISTLEEGLVQVRITATSALTKANTAINDSATALQKANQAIDGLANKVDKEAGKGLSSNDFTDTYKGKLDNPVPVSHVGMIIQSTTLDTEAKVKAIYGSTTSWLQHDGYLLIAGTNVTDNQAREDTTIELEPSTSGTQIKTKNVYVWERTQ